MHFYNRLKTGAIEERPSEDDKKYIWPTVQVACVPDNIKWENLGYSNLERAIRSLMVWLAALAIVFFSILTMVTINAKLKQFKEDNKSYLPCDSDLDPTVAKQAAWNEVQLPVELRGGSLTCYCKPLLKKLGPLIYAPRDDTRFTEFTLPNGYPDKHMYCTDWANSFWF